MSSRIFDVLSKQIKTRLIASGVHLAGSIAVISVYLGFVLFVWYPYPYSVIHSVSHVIWILVGVDVVLGPLFTLLIFDVRKPRAELKRDIGIIVLIQISALLWGIGVTYEMRPVFAVFQEDTIYTVVKKDIDVDRLPAQMSLPAFWERPKMIYIPPLSTEEKIAVGIDAVKGTAPDVMYQAQRYRPFSADAREDALRHAIPYEKLTDLDNKKRAMRKFLDRHHGVMEDYAFYPVESAGFTGTIAFRKSDFSMVGLLGS